jgi:long-subunit acyl-CoA synthetase (AMP-forming)
LERIHGLYLALDAGIISNYLESPETARENLQELKPTLLGAERRRR